MQRTRTSHQSASRTIYGALLYLYPREFRRKHGSEMLQNFEDLEHDFRSKQFLWGLIISDLFTSLTHEYMEYLKQRPWLQLVLGAIIIVGVLFTWQVLYLQKAHSTFENYAAFRGCTSITSHEETSGTCTTATGQTVQIVQFDNKWFLAGDLPQCAIGFRGTCLINWP